MPSLVVSITARRHFIFMTNNSSGSRAASRGVPRPLRLRQNSCRQCRRRRQRQQCDGDDDDGSNDLFFGTIRGKKDKKYLFGSKLNENIYAKHTHMAKYSVCVCVIKKICKVTQICRRRRRMATTATSNEH